LFFSWIRTAKDYLTGFFLYDLMHGVYSEKRRLDSLVMIFLFGRIIGFPHLFNYYHLRLLPHYLGQLGPWRRRVLRERDFFDHIRD
jgi:hypothetical protein